MTYKPKIYVDTELANDNLTEETLQYISSLSITPEVIKERKFFTDEITFTDLFETGDNSVKRFGINTMRLDVSSIAKQEQINLHNPEDNKSTSSRSIATTDIPKRDQDISHLPIEKTVFSKAIEYIATSKEPTVLLDIIARDKKGKLQITKSSTDEDIFETHTVLLFNKKQDSGQSKILVIDPSNFSFSSHLAVLAKNITLPDRCEVVVKPKSKLQIYKPHGETGPNNDQFRDCIDIAVKLAFGLNESDKIVNLKKIDKHPVVQAISNIQKIDDDIFFKKEVTARCKQSSKNSIKSKFQKISYELKTVLKISELLEISDLQTEQALLTKLLIKFQHKEEGIFKTLSQQYHLRFQELQLYLQKGYSETVAIMGNDFNLEQYHETTGQ